MAISTPPLWTKDVDPFQATFDVTDVAIGGKLLQANIQLTTMEQMSFLSDDDFKRVIKQKIASELARVMIESNLVEFTHMVSHVDGTTNVHARCYLAPDNQVKVLRLHYANTNKR